MVQRLPGADSDHDDCPICRAMGTDLSEVPVGESLTVPIESEEDLERLRKAFAEAGTILR